MSQPLGVGRFADAEAFDKSWHEMYAPSFTAHDCNEACPMLSLMHRYLEQTPCRVFRQDCLSKAGFSTEVKREDFQPDQAGLT